MNYRYVYLLFFEFMWIGFFTFAYFTTLTDRIKIEILPDWYNILGFIVIYIIIWVIIAIILYFLFGIALINTLAFGASLLLAYYGGTIAMVVYNSVMNVIWGKKDIVFFNSWLKIRYLWSEKELINKMFSIYKQKGGRRKEFKTEMISEILSRVWAKGYGYYSLSNLENVINEILRDERPLTFKQWSWQKFENLFWYIYDNISK